MTAKQITIQQALQHIKLAHLFNKMGLRDLAIELLDEASILIALANAEIAL